MGMKKRRVFKITIGLFTGITLIVLQTILTLVNVWAVFSKQISTLLKGVIK